MPWRWGWQTRRRLTERRPRPRAMGRGSAGCLPPSHPSPRPHHPTRHAPGGVPQEGGYQPACVARVAEWRGTTASGPPPKQPTTKGQPPSPNRICISVGKTRSALPLRTDTAGQQEPRAVGPLVFVLGTGPDHRGECHSVRLLSKTSAHAAICLHTFMLPLQLHLSSRGASLLPLRSCARLEPQRSPVPRPWAGAGSRRSPRSLSSR